MEGSKIVEQLLANAHFKRSFIIQTVVLGGMMTNDKVAIL